MCVDYYEAAIDRLVQIEIKKFRYNYENYFKYFILNSIKKLIHPIEFEVLEEDKDFKSIEDIMNRNEIEIKHIIVEGETIEWYEIWQYGNLEFKSEVKKLYKMPKADFRY